MCMFERLLLCHASSMLCSLRCPNIPPFVVRSPTVTFTLTTIQAILSAVTISARLTVLFSLTLRSSLRLSLLPKDIYILLLPSNHPFLLHTTPHHTLSVRFALFCDQTCSLLPSPWPALDSHPHLHQHSQYLHTFPFSSRYSTHQQTTPYLHVFAPAQVFPSTWSLRDLSNIWLALSNLTQSLGSQTTT